MSKNSVGEQYVIRHVGSWFVDSRMHRQYEREIQQLLDTGLIATAVQTFSDARLPAAERFVYTRAGIEILERAGRPAEVTKAYLRALCGRHAALRQHYEALGLLG